jgi:hypothetical protein
MRPEVQSPAPKKTEIKGKEIASGKYEKMFSFTSNHILLVKKHCWQIGSSGRVPL